MPDYATRRTMMVDTQVRPADVTKFPIIDAMLTVPRERFMPDTRRETAYMGENVSLGGARVVLEPRTLAKFLDALSLDPDDLVLDVGTNHGYSAAVMARLAEAVVALEEDPDMAREAEAALSDTETDNVAVVTGDLTKGAEKHGPYDAILIQGGVEEVPAALTQQLKEGGRIGALFMEGALGTARIGWKADGHVSWRYAFNAAAPVIPGFERQRDFAL